MCHQDHLTILISARTSATRAIQHVDEGRLGGGVEVERRLVEDDHLAVAGDDGAEVQRLVEARARERQWQIQVAALDVYAEPYVPRALVRGLPRLRGRWRRSGRLCRRPILPLQDNLKGRPGEFFERTLDSLVAFPRMVIAVLGLEQVEGQPLAAAERERVAADEARDTDVLLRRPPDVVGEDERSPEQRQEEVGGGIRLAALARRA